jgi:aryl-alcohol dehydrogenase-like predicted oxidoreductase
VIERIRIGKSDLFASRIGIGGNKFGPNLNSKEVTREILDTAIELGINFIDTATIYGDGESETYIGEALGGRRNEFIISTKTYLSDRGTTSVAQHLRNRLEQSLHKLGTDYVDLFQIHRADPSIPTDEVMLALNELVDSGMTRAIGCSNYATWRLTESNLRAETVEASRFVSIQREYNLLKRGAEAELVDACCHLGVTLIPYFPLASGLLWRESLSGSERWQLGPVARPAQIERTVAVLSALSKFARESHHSLGELAIAWLVSQDVIGPVITGIRSGDQLRSNARAAEWQLSDEEMTIVNEISSTGDEIRTDDPFSRQKPPGAKTS